MALGLWSTNSQAQTLSPGKHVLDGMMMICSDAVGLLQSMDALETKGPEAADKIVDELYKDGTCAPFMGTTPELHIVKALKTSKYMNGKYTVMVYLYEVKVDDKTVYINLLKPENAS